MPLNGRGREKTIAAIEHGGRGEELRLCIIRNYRDQPELLELRNWLQRDDLDGQRGPTSHGLQIPLTVIPWLVEKLQEINAPRLTFEQKFENEMTSGDGESQ